MQDVLNPKDLTIHDLQPIDDRDRAWAREHRMFHQPSQPDQNRSTFCHVYIVLQLSNMTRKWDF